VTTAYINRIASAVPPYDVHEMFVDFVKSQLQGDNRKSALFNRMVEKSAIDHRYSCLQPADGPNGAMDADGHFVRGRFPDTAQRMRLFDMHAPVLAARAVDKLQLGEGRRSISHLIVACCTGFSAPGLDLEIVERCGLDASVERTIVGFMGCYAAMNALKLGMEKSGFQGREDTDKLIAALEGLEMKEGDDFPQGDKTLRKDDHQAFLRQFIFEVKGGKPKILEVVAKDKTIFPPACKFT